ncbi:hypothetical protein KFU94_21435 [Chloroflexi bacterium TSY]|nr:hypothetical protein [Chloroflexi bacterium TSY]
MTPKSLQSRLKIAKNAKFGSTETQNANHWCKDQTDQKTTAGIMPSEGCVQYDDTKQHRV